MLGTRAQANHYIQQFTEIFTEEGRKNVRIKHVIPGQAPRVSCTPGMQRAHAQVHSPLLTISSDQDLTQNMNTGAAGTAIATSAIPAGRSAGTYALHVNIFG